MNTTKPAATKKSSPPAFIAGASCPPDIAMILESVEGKFRVILMWGTNTDANSGAHIEAAEGISLHELEELMFEGPSVLRQGDGWKLEVDACDAFVEFIFTYRGGEPTSVSVSMEILSSVFNASRPMMPPVPIEARHMADADD
jgi:hypothetical protein